MAKIQIEVYKNYTCMYVLYKDLHTYVRILRKYLHLIVFETSATKMFTIRLSSTIVYITTFRTCLSANKLL